MGLLLSACGSDSLGDGLTATYPANPAPTEITVWSWGAGLKGLQANLPAFNRADPGIKVNLVEVRQSEIYEKLDAGLLAGGVGLPDVVQVETERLDYFTTKFPEGFVDLKSWAGKYEGQFDPLKWATVKRIGRIRALPWDSEPVGLFYRADLFQKAGIDPARLQTWDDFVEAGGRLTRLDPKFKLMAFNPDDDTLFRMMMFEQGASYFTQDNKINLTSPEAIRSLTLIKKMYEGGLLLAAQPPDLLSDLRGNQAASYVANASWAATLQANAPEMAGKWDVMPLPAMTVGGNHTVSLGGSMLAALRTGKSQEAASAFMEYCLANKDTQNLMLRQFGLLPSFLPAYDNAFYSTPQPYFNNKPIWQFFAREVPQLKLIYYTKDFEQATDTAAVAQLLALIQIDPTQALLRQSNDLKDLTAREVIKPGTSPTPNPGTRS